LKVFEREERLSIEYVDEAEQKRHEQTMVTAGWNIINSHPGSNVIKTYTKYSKHFSITVEEGK
jgi:hypothetical protein